MKNLGKQAAIILGDSQLHSDSHILLLCCAGKLCKGVLDDVVGKVSEAQAYISRESVS